MEFNYLALRITDTCPLECAHCCVDSGPWRVTAMDLEEARSYVRQAKAMNPQAVLAFTGGEPFVRFALMRDIAATAHELGMPHSTITSAVWCKTQSFARERLAALQEVGLRFVNVSYDSFHEPWVTPEKVRNCISAAVDLGLPVSVLGAMTRDSRGPAELLGDWISGLPGVQVVTGPVQPSGRGALIALDSLLIADQTGENPRCPTPTQLLIEGDGTVYPCCSTGGDYDFLRTGNARETPLAELRSSVGQQTWFRVIAEHGFGALEQIVRAYYPETRFPSHYTYVCHLCQLVLGQGELAATVHDALARYEADSLRASLEIWGKLQTALSTSGGGRG